MRGKTKKATFNLHTDVLTALDEIMAQGIASSKNALVEQALLKELKELKRQARKALWQEAAKDPLFLKDVTEVEMDFRYADAETVGNMDQ
jgi:predicted transcriptional regulator